MWFLQIDKLLLLLVLSLAFGIASAFSGEKYKKILRFLPIAEIVALWYISEKLTVFYIGYILITWLFVLFLRRIRGKRSFWFGVLCIGCCFPLIYMRAASFAALPTMGLICVGIAYNMLKAIDVLYYEYYTGERAELEVYINYILFLPVMTAGPVFRYRDFLASWKKPLPLTLSRFVYGLKRCISGLFFKVVLSAVSIRLLEGLLSGEPSLIRSAVIPLISLAVLYFDMAGYASIAIGLGHIMGITVPENFKKPFACASFTQFWRNWHVTVSDWIREHVFILFQSRKLKKWQGALISLAVMVIMGLWHGFSLLYLIDGVLLGMILFFEAIFNLSTVNKRKTPPLIFALRCFAVIYIFAVNSMVFTLSSSEIGDVFSGYFNVIGGVIS